MPGREQHYIPQFHQRRFGIEPRNKKTLVWRLDKRSGRPERVKPAEEAVIRDYYAVVLEDGTVANDADDVLGYFENDVAPIIDRLVREPDWKLGGREVMSLLYYIVTLKKRTPQARAEAKETSERGHEMLFEAMLSDRERFYRTAAKTGESREDLERHRKRILHSLRAGKIEIPTTPSGEVAMMLMATEDVVKRLFTDLGVICVRVPPDSRNVFVTSDHPVAHYDPTPRHEHAGSGFMSSPKSVTTIALDPRLALFLVQDHPQQWANDVATDEDVQVVNLLTYTHAYNCIYGPTQAAVTDLRALARRSPNLRKELRRRPPRVWLGRSESDAPGPVTFTSRSKHGDATKTFYVRDQRLAPERQIWPPLQRSP